MVNVVRYNKCVYALEVREMDVIDKLKENQKPLNKVVAIQVRLEREKYEAWREYAMRRGVTMSSMIRAVVDDFIINHKSPYDK